MSTTPRRRAGAVLAGAAALALAGLAPAASAMTNARAVTAVAGVPTNLAPNDPTTTLHKDVILSWDTATVSGAASYEVQVSPDGSFSSTPTLDTAGITQDQLALPETLPHASYFWRVRAVDSTGLPGAWSGAAQFTRGWSGAPANPQFDPTSLTFSWDPLEDASAYEVELSPSPTFPTPAQTGQGKDLSYSCTTNHTSWTLAVLDVPTTGVPVDGLCPGATVNAGDTYYWRVRGRDGTFETPLSADTAAKSGCFGLTPQDPYPTPGPNATPIPECSLWSTTQTLTIPLAAHTPTNGTGLPAPANAAVVGCNGTVCPDTPGFAWDSVPNADYYRLTVATDPNFTNVQEVWHSWDSGVAGRRFSRESNSLPDYGAGDGYYWSVQACNTGLGQPQVQATATGSGGTLPQADYGVVVTAVGMGGETMGTEAPVSTTGDSSQIAATWAPVDGAQSYNVYFGLAGQELLVENTAATSVTITGPMSPIGGTPPVYNSTDGCGYPTIGHFTKVSPAVHLLAPANGATTGQARTTLSWSSYLDTQAAAAGYTCCTDWGPNTAYPQNQVAYYQGVPYVALNAVAAGAGTPDAASGWLALSDQEAKAYRLQVATDVNFGHVVEDVTVDRHGETAGVSEYTSPSVVYPDGTLYWRVQAIDGSGNHLPWSATASFTKDTAALTASLGPAGVAVNGHLTVSFSAPPAAGTVTGTTVRVADAANATVAGSLAQQDATHWTFTPASALVPGQTYHLVLTSGVHNSAGTAATVAGGAVRASTTVDNTSPAATETWERDSYAKASGGAYLRSFNPGDTATLHFTGTSVKLVAPRAADGGYGELYLDGQHVATLDYYARSTTWNVTMFSRTGLSNAAHTLQLRADGTHPAGANGSSVFIDDFVVGATTVQENAASVVDGWRRVAASDAVGGSEDNAQYLYRSYGAAPSFATRFVGSAVKVTFCKGPDSGDAAILVDGVLKGSVDLFQSYTSCGWSWSLATSTGSVHTLVVRPTGQVPAGSKGTRVAVDAVRVS